MYHLVFPEKYRRVVFNKKVDGTLKNIYLEIEKHYQIKFLEIGPDEDHVHFLVQPVPTHSMTKLVTMIKRLTARQVFKECSEVKKQLWGAEFWSDGFFASTVSKYGDEAKIANYVKNQGNDAKYDRLNNSNQLSIFE